MKAMATPRSPDSSPMSLIMVSRSTQTSRRPSRINIGGMKISISMKLSSDMRSSVPLSRIQKVLERGNKGSSIHQTVLGRGVCRFADGPTRTGDSTVEQPIPA